MSLTTYAALAQIREITKGEAIFRPSAATRWTKCKGSVWAALRIPKETRSSRAAQDGTAAHHIAAEALLGVRQPHEWTDRMVAVDGGLSGVFVDEEMQEHVQGYVDFVRAEAEGADEIYIEKQMTLSVLDPQDPLLQENRGTGDVVILFKKARRIKIIDLKYGRGVMISAKSLQVADYGLLGMLNFPLEGGWDHVECIIYQPRAPREDEKLKRHVYTSEELLTDFLGQLLQAMTEGIQPDAQLIAGPHCKDTFCPAAATCPALQDFAINLGRDMFTEAPIFTAISEMAPVPSKEQIQLPQPAQMDVSDIATILERSEIYDSWLSAVKQYAVQLMTAGAQIPGWMLTTSNTHRRWKEEPAQVVPELVKLGLKTENLYSEPKLKSPAQVEKLLPKAQRASINTLAEKPPGAVVLTRADASRPAIAPVFTALPVAD